MPSIIHEKQKFPIVLAILTTLFVVLHSRAGALAQNSCDEAAAIAATETNVPLSVLKAVTRTETGRTRKGVFEPWPWSINADGDGSWHQTKSAAENFALDFVSSGNNNIDVGCFQLNFRWHGHAFSSISEMLEPVTNAKYAAGFLSQLFAETGDWTSAVGAFHSRTHEHADRYKKKYAKIYAQLREQNSASSPRSSRPDRLNQFPLLKPSNTKPAKGSLVPITDNANARGLLFWQEGI